MPLHELLEWFGREQACYTTLLDLCGRQKAALLANEAADLPKILKQKHRVLAQVRQIENRLIPYKHRWQTLRADLDDNERSVLDIALATIEELLVELIELERACERLLGVQPRDQDQPEPNASALTSRSAGQRP